MSFSTAAEGNSIKVVSIVKKEGIVDGIRHHFKKDYVFNKKALGELLLKDPKVKDRIIVPISIAGAMRRGKSFMLGFFLRYLRARYEEHDVSNWLGGDNEELEGFEWRNGMVDPTTTGINIWSKVFLYDDDQTGDKLAILLIDTQGVFDTQSTPKDNNVIFAVSTLISSVQIFNVMGNIQEDDLQNLQQFAAYGQFAVDQAGAPPFQKILFLVRDWPEDPNAPWGLVGGRYLINKRFDSAEELTGTRDQIKAVFAAIDCYLMPHPGLPATRSKFKGCLKDVEEDFKDHLKRFVPHVLAPENLVRKVNGRIMKARDFVEFFDVIVALFNSDKAPKAENVFEANVRSNNLSAVLSCFELYVEEFKNLNREFRSIEEFDKAHGEINTKVCARFEEETKFGGKEYSQEYRTMLEEKIEKLYKPFREEVKVKLAENGMVDGEIINIILVSLKFVISSLIEEIVAAWEGVKAAVEAAAEAVADAVGDFVRSVFN